MGDTRDLLVVQENERYENLLGLSAPCSVLELDLQVKEMGVTARLMLELLQRFRWPESGDEYIKLDHGHPHIQQPDTSQYATMSEAGVPRCG